MFTATLTAPSNQRQAAFLVQEIEPFRRRNQVRVDKRYMIFKEIIESPTIKMGLQNFKMTLDFSDYSVAQLMCDRWNGAMQ